MTKRNLEHEFREMGLEDDEEEWHRLEQIDHQRQLEACRRDYHKDVADFIAWRKANRPTRTCYSRSSPGRTSPAPSSGPETPQTKSTCNCVNTNSSSA